MVNSFYHFGKDPVLNGLSFCKKTQPFGLGFLFHLSEVRVELALKWCLKWETVANLKPPSLERAPEGTAWCAGKCGQTQLRSARIWYFNFYFCKRAAFVLTPCVSFWGEVIQGFIPLGWCNCLSRFSTVTVPAVTAGSVPWEGTKHRSQCVTAPALTHLMTRMMTWCQELLTGRRHLTTQLHASACHLGCPSLQQLCLKFVSP